MLAFLFIVDTNWTVDVFEALSVGHHAHFAKCFWPLVYILNLIICIMILMMCDIVVISYAYHI